MIEPTNPNQSKSEMAIPNIKIQNPIVNSFCVGFLFMFYILPIFFLNLLTHLLNLDFDTPPLPPFFFLESAGRKNESLTHQLEFRQGFCSPASVRQNGSWYTSSRIIPSDAPVKNKNSFDLVSLNLGRKSDTNAKECQGFMILSCT